jgi:histidinol-phosphate aminotransferase
MSRSLQVEIPRASLEVARPSLEVTRPSLEVARASYQSISLYSPNRTPCRLDLSDNTNMWGVPPTVRSLLGSSADSVITRYPRAYADDLKRAIGGYLNVAPACVVTGCGSDDVLDSAIRAFSEPGQTLAYPDPSFAMVEIFARMNGLSPLAIPLTGDFDADADAFIASGAPVIYLCSPNNPTGTVLSRPSIERIIENAPGVVILDEAYAEFADGDCLDLLPKSERLVITRTMSKAFGLAGLRVGYAIGAAELVREIEKSRGPYKVSSLAERAAITALTEDRQWVEDRIVEAREARAGLTRELAKRGLGPLASEANFVLARVERVERLAVRLRENGVAVRPFPGLTGIGDAIRITVGPWAMMEECFAALDGVLR